MITTTRTFTRPSTAVAWWHDSSESAEKLPSFSERLQRDYINTAKIIDRKITGDSLNIIVTIKWATKVAMNAHYNDTDNVAYFALRDAYNAANGITTTFTQA